jgi:hypothetical protein
MWRGTGDGTGNMPTLIGMQFFVWKVLVLSLHNIMTYAEFWYFFPQSDDKYIHNTHGSAVLKRD